jgi:2-phospho-L-lactate guanylyltransferase
MKLWLIVPVKPFSEGKSRLAAVLPPATRAVLSRRLFQHVLREAIASDLFAGILVVSRDLTVLDGLSSAAVALIPESGHELNQAIQQGRQAALQRGADAILVLPADLPRLHRGDLHALCAASTAPHSVVIVPSADNGTNALLLRPPHIINFAFGRNSFAYHCRSAQLAGIPCVIHDSPHLAFDVDWPADLDQLDGVFLDPQPIPSSQPCPL